MRAFLLILDGPRAGRLHALGDGGTLIGRREDADITLADSAVSSDHARLEYRRDGYYLVDLGSRNGTRVNGRPVNECRLRKKDRIQIGGTTIVFLEENAAEATLTVTVAQHEGPTTARRAPLAATTSAKIVETTGVPQEEHPIVGMVRKVTMVWRFIKRHGWFIIPLPALGLALGVLSMKIWPAPELTSAAVKLTQTQQLNPVDDRQNNSQTGWEVTPTFFEKPEANFANPELVDTVLGKLQIESNPGLIAVVMSGLAMKKEGTLYVASYSQPLKSKIVPSVEFLNEYLERYLSREVERAIKVIKAEAGFVENELKKIDTELNDVESELLAFQRKHINSLPESAGAVISGKGTLAMSQAGAELEVDRLRMQVANARSQLSNTDSVVTRRVDDLKPIQADLDAKKRDLSNLRAKGLKSDHPEVVQLTNQIARLESEIQTRMSSGVTEQERITDPARQEAARKLQQYEADLRVAEGQLSRLSKQVGAAAGLAAQIPEVEATVVRLKRRADDLLGLRGQLFERHRKTMVQVDLERAQVRARYEILSPAAVAPAASQKFKAIRLGGGFGGGLFLALAIAAVFETRRLLRKHPGLVRADAA